MHAVESYMHWNPDKPNTWGLPGKMSSWVTGVRYPKHITVTTARNALGLVIPRYSFYKGYVTRFLLRAVAGVPSPLLG